MRPGADGMRLGRANRKRFLSSQASGRLYRRRIASAQVPGCLFIEIDVRIAARKGRRGSLRRSLHRRRPCISPAQRLTALDGHRRDSAICVPPKEVRRRSARASARNRPRSMPVPTCAAGCDWRNVPPPCCMRFGLDAETAFPRVAHYRLKRERPASATQHPRANEKAYALRISVRDPPAGQCAQASESEKGVTYAWPPSPRVPTDKLRSRSRGERI